MKAQIKIWMGNVYSAFLALCKCTSDTPMLFGNSPIAKRNTLQNTAKCKTHPSFPTNCFVPNMWLPTLVAFRIFGLRASSGSR